MKIQAPLVPLETEKIQDLTGPALLIGNQAVIGHVENHACGKYRTPMCHEAVILAIIMRQVRQIHGEVETDGEPLEITRQASIYGVPSHMDNAGIREYRVNCTQILDVDEGLVDDARCIASPSPERTQIVLAQPLSCRLVEIPLNYRRLVFLGS